MDVPLIPLLASMENLAMATTPAEFGADRGQKVTSRSEKPWRGSLLMITRPGKLSHNYGKSP